MATDLRNSDTSTGSTGTTNPVALLGEIISDSQELLREQLAMFRAELAEDMAKTKHALTPLFIAGGVGFVGLLMLAHMFVYLLDWAITNEALWVDFGIVAFVLFVAAVGLYFAGKKSFESFNPLPDKSFEAMKENVQCLTHPDQVEHHQNKPK